jgi:hypothetical protein
LAVGSTVDDRRSAVARAGVAAARASVKAAARNMAVFLLSCFAGDCPSPRLKFQSKTERDVIELAENQPGKSRHIFN